MVNIPKDMEMRVSIIPKHLIRLSLVIGMDYMWDHHFYDELFAAHGELHLLLIGPPFNPKAYKIIIIIVIVIIIILNNDKVVGLLIIIIIIMFVIIMIFMTMIIMIIIVHIFIYIHVAHAIDLNNCRKDFKIFSTYQHRMYLKKKNCQILRKIVYFIDFNKNN